MSEPDKRLGHIETLRAVKTDLTSDINTSMSLARESVDTNLGKRRHLRFCVLNTNYRNKSAGTRKTNEFVSLFPVFTLKLRELVIRTTSE